MTEQEQPMHLSDRQEKTLMRYAERIADERGKGDDKMAPHDIIEGLFAKGRDAVEGAIKVQFEIEEGTGIKNLISPRRSSYQNEVSKPEPHKNAISKPDPDRSIYR